MADVSRSVAKKVLHVLFQEGLGAQEFDAVNRFLLQVNGGADLGANDPKLTDTPQALVRKTLAVLDGATINFVD